ncbi:MAG: tRNA lysidine(34) synthetase TilS [Clostridia bacterium]
MENVKQFILSNNMFEEGDIVGVATSGGPDSMALLCKLRELSNEFGIEVICVHVDHSIRDNSSEDAQFVMDFCKEKRIRAYKFRVDVKKLQKEKCLSLEEAARDARYGVFEQLFEKGIVTKIALAHHQQDQAETVLLHLLRGAGLSGASGMKPVRDGKYVRPILDVSKDEIELYLLQNDIPYVMDQSNLENEFSRNFLRNVILPQLNQRFPGCVNALYNFSKTCGDDEAFISAQVPHDACLLRGKTVMIPVTYFLYPTALTTRMIFQALKKIKGERDVTRKHIEQIREIAKLENGKKLSLPNNVIVHKEYEYVTLTNDSIVENQIDLPFKCGNFLILDKGVLSVHRTKNFSAPKTLFLDWKKVPEGARWRFRQNGDVFEKFGGGTKKLKSYFVDKKIPSRIRGILPVLALGNQIFAIAGVEIANSVCLDQETTTAFAINYSLNS